MIDQFHVVSVCDCLIKYLFYFILKAYFRDALNLVFCNDKFSEYYLLLTAGLKHSVEVKVNSYLGDRTLFYFYLRTNPDFLFTVKY